MKPIDTTPRDQEMTIRQRCLVDYLMAHSEPVNQGVILADMGKMYDEDYDGTEAHYHMTKARLEMTNDIAEIRDKHLVAIISNKKGIMIGTAEQAVAMHKRRLWNAIQKLNREREILRLYGIRGQFDTDGNWVDVEEAEQDGREKNVQ